MYFNLIDYKLFKSVIRDGEEKTERLERLEKQRQVAMDACKTISSAVRNNRTTSVTRHIGTLTMLFGAATSVGLIVFKEPTLVNIFSSVALAGFAIGGNRIIHRNTTLKMNMHKEMVILAETKYNELSSLDVSKSDLKEIPIPQYNTFEKQARATVNNNKTKILKKSNYKTIKNTMSSFAIIATIGAGFNYTEKNGYTNIENGIGDNIRELISNDGEESLAQSTSLRPQMRPSI